jgi:hypothetical protein
VCFPSCFFFEREIVGHLICCFCLTSSIYMMKSMLFRFFHSWIKQTMAISEIRKRVGVNNVFCIKFGFQMFSFHVYMTCSSLSKMMGHAVFRLWVKRLVWLSSSIAWETVGCKGLCHPCFPLVGASLCNWNVT